MRKRDDEERGKTMQAIVYHGSRQLTLAELDVPKPGPGEALVRVQAVGVCGSELEGYLGHSSVRKAPLVMGHEFCGVIEGLGPGASGFLIGDRVIANPLVSCGTCDRCRIGKGNICRQRQIIGIHRPGAFAEYVSVPAANLHAAPAGLDAGVASLAEPLAVCIHALKLGMRPFEDAVIFGAGPIGLLTLQAGLAMGARRLLVVDRQPERLAFAETLGAEIATPDRLEEACERVFPGGADTFIDCVGVQATREQAIRLVNPGGSVILVGLGQDESLLPMNHAVRQEISLIGSYTYSDADFAQAAALLARGSITGRNWMTACSLSEAPRVFADLADGTARFSKYVLIPSEGAR
ncbi:zinc-binding dehydrogenase [Cohnella boryungensis]|uniref:Zinc-binding dehydrogenase n=2 Tax=Cohnella boryungensis TaxID=768479 RepID=A0ABV8SJD7_9BACL